MKGIVKIIVLSSMFSIFSNVMAGNDVTSSQPANSSMWICTTNASSATSGSSDEQADNQMAKNAANGPSAFDFALKNCRDCTKITCEQQTKPAQ